MWVRWLPFAFDLMVSGSPVDYTKLGNRVDDFSTLVSPPPDMGPKRPLPEEHKEQVPKHNNKAYGRISSFLASGERSQTSVTGSDPPANCPAALGLCDPCYMAIPMENCPAWKLQCQKSICMPLCIGDSFDVEVKNAGKLQAEIEGVGNPGKVAFTAMFSAMVCEDLGCCSGPEVIESLADYVSDRIYKGDSIEPFYPIPSCKNEPDRKKACDDCVALGMTIEVKKKGGSGCEQFQKYGTPSDEGYSDAFGDAGQDPVGNVPKHISMQFRCKGVEKAISSKSSFAISKKICSCMGCCTDPHCPFAAAYGHIDDALNDPDFGGHK